MQVRVPVKWNRRSVAVRLMGLGSDAGLYEVVNGDGNRGVDEDIRWISGAKRCARLERYLFMRGVPLAVLSGEIRCPACVWTTTSLSGCLFLDVQCSGWSFLLGRFDL